MSYSRGIGAAFSPKAMVQKSMQKMQAAAQQMTSGKPGGGAAPWYKAPWVLPVGIGVAALLAFMVIKKRKKSGASTPAAPATGG